MRSTALVRRIPTGLTAHDWHAFLTSKPLEPTTLPSDPVMVTTFVGTLALIDTQVLALRRPVLDLEIEWKPAETNGPPVIPYLSHNGYRDRLDAAFGLGGWGMVPVGQPKEKDGSVFVPYAMVIGGVPRIYTWGEQQQHKMSYGDALEGAKSNAIVRCGKELGIARELWNRAHITALKHRRGAVVADGQQRASDHPTWDARELEPITKPQQQRLWLIIKHSGRRHEDVQAWLKQSYQVEATKAIARKDYTAICTAVEKPGPLPVPAGD
jgi:hypothetical protein